MADTPIRVQPDAPIDVNVMAQSPHVVAYRFWKQAPGESAWTVLIEGTAIDDAPKHEVLGTFPTGTVVLYWLAFGGQPNTPYKGLVTFGQGGAIVSGGTRPEGGVASGQGSVAVKRRVVLNA